MKPPAPVTQIFIFLWPSVNFFSATEGRTMVAVDEWYVLSAFVDRCGTGHKSRVGEGQARGI